MSNSDFSSLQLSQQILATLWDEGYREPTPIQSQTIPALRAGNDVLGCAQTGTGKTAAFALPILEQLIAAPRRCKARSVRFLIVAPTRELAAQIDTAFETYGKQVRFTHTCIYGGVPRGPQVRLLSQGVDVLVATPGRLLDLQSTREVFLNAVETVVLDEADRMLDMGFIRDIRKIIALLPTDRQTVLFSATMPEAIGELARSIQRDPVRVSVAPEKTTADNVAQSVMFVEKNDKRALLSALLGRSPVSRVLVFTRTKHGADRLARSLSISGISADAIHANKSQNARTRTLEGFRRGSVKVLVATDLASRGIDVDGITHVFNFELPNEAETYVHRIGRTARAGASGKAVSLCAPEERPLLRAIEKLLGGRIPVENGNRVPVYAGAR